MSSHHRPGEEWKRPLPAGGSRTRLVNPPVSPTTDAFQTVHVLPLLVEAPAKLSGTALLGAGWLPPPILRRFPEAAPVVLNVLQRAVGRGQAKGLRLLTHAGFAVVVGVVLALVEVGVDRGDLRLLGAAAEVAEMVAVRRTAPGMA